ncbi:MAG: hypothetical protein JSR27_13125 [Proteobacteria bacterium]|nr:hypothetical protein [Pseudomonadota bacterium]
MRPAGKAAALKDLLHRDGERHAEVTRVRIHRAISWLARAEQERDDHDAQFVFLWIAFNAAYARAFGLEEHARVQLAAFFQKLLSLDSDKRLAKLLFSEFSGPVRTLLANKFVFEPFWTALRDHDSSGQWEDKFNASTKLATAAILDGRTEIVLSVVFDRLYVLRNQLVHGGATWNSSLNRAQVKDGANIMLSVVPAIIELMLRNPDVDFGEILYPVV